MKLHNKKDYGMIFSFMMIYKLVGLLYFFLSLILLITYYSGKRNNQACYIQNNLISDQNENGS